jgi:hypothetical protein
MIRTKIIIFIVGLIVGSSAPLIYIWFDKTDEYCLVSYTLSPNRERVGIVVANIGGGGPGYCRDLIYDFPYKDGVPDLHFENKNKKYLIAEQPCGHAKSLLWADGKLRIN